MSNRREKKIMKSEQALIGLAVNFEIDQLYQEVLSFNL